MLRWNINKVDWENWTSAMETHLTQAVDNLGIEDPCDDLYSILKNNVLAVAREHIGKSSLGKRHKIWWDSELDNSLREVKRAKKSFKKRSSEAHLQEYLDKKQEFFQLYKLKHQQFLFARLKSFCEDQDAMWKLIKQHSANPHSAIQPIVSGNSVKITDEEIAEEFLKVYGQHSLIVDPTMVEPVI